jgi:glucose uptake protein
LNAKAYRKLKSGNAVKVSEKGLLLSVLSGCLMGLFYKYVAGSMAADFSVPKPGN